jgi:Ca-activated chloride channel family protein
MRKVVWILLATVVWFSAGASVALADGMLLPLPEEAPTPGYLGVRYHHVSVTIEDNHAVTRVEQEFTNPHDYPVAGRYLFPVPPEAILSRFEATVDGQRQSVVRQDPAATNEELYAIVAQQRDPSLLRYADWESLAFNLSLDPGASRKMILEYEEVLAPAGGLYRYRYVLSTERYSSLPLTEVSVKVDVRSSAGLASIYSPSHVVVTQRLGPGRALVSWEAQEVNPGEDFELFFAPAETGFGGGLLTGERDGQDHLLFLFSPETELRQTDSLPKDIVFVIDRSGSMSGDKIEQARNALHFILGQLGEADRFSIVSFDDRISVWADLLQPVEKGSLQSARDYVDWLSADGSTDLETALQTGLEVLDRSENRGALRMVVFLTDGLPTAGITDEALIARLVTETNSRLEARLHVFGVGYDVNSHLLDRLAADNSGSVTYVQPGENLELALTQFYGKIAYPVLTGIEIVFEGLEVDDLYPQDMPDLFQGSSLLLTGRYTAKADTVSVRVHGWAGDARREFVYHFDLAEAGGRDFVPRLWATRRVGALLDQVRLEGESPALVDEIRDLGLGYGLVTPYTTFIIEGQAGGAASAQNMDLYGRADLNQASGETTIRARVQNQMYQQAAQVDLAAGANVANYGQRSLAQVGTQQVDLSLLQGRQDIDAAVSTDWLVRNVEVDRTVEFGTEEYFALAADPELRPFLQSGSNVVFATNGQVIAVRDDHYGAADSEGEEAPAEIKQRAPEPKVELRQPTSMVPGSATSGTGLLIGLLSFVVGAMLLGLAFVSAVAVYLLRVRTP